MAADRCRPAHGNAAPAFTGLHDDERAGEDSGMNALAAETLPRVFPTVVHMLADACARFPNATALVCGRRNLSYTEYLRCVAGFAQELVVNGARDSRVALVCATGAAARPRSVRTAPTPFSCLLAWRFRGPHHL
jgi:hypothetical protein